MRNFILSFLVSLIFCAPSAFASPTVTSAPATEVSDISAKLSGTINVNSVGLWLIEFQIGKTTALELSAVPPEDRYYIEGPTVGNDTQTLYSPKLNLLPGTTYHFRFSARNGNNLNEVYHGNILSFTTIPEEAGGTLPTAFSYDLGLPYPFSHKEAALNARIFSGSSPTKIFLRYGTATPLDKQSSIDELQVTNTTEDETIEIKGLAPSTTYYYRWMVTNSAGTSFSETKTLTTSASPTLTTNPATAIGPDFATLHGAVNVNGGRSALVSFEYGETEKYGKDALSNPPLSSATTGATTHAANITGLRPETTYHFRVKTSQNASRAIEFGPARTFTTNAAGEAPSFNVDPVIVSVNTSSTTVAMPEFFTGTSAARLVADYGPDPQFGLSVDEPNSFPSFTTVSNREITLTGLAPETLYYFRFRATNSTGAALSGTLSFQTSRAPTATTGPVENLGDISAEPTGTFDNAGGIIYPGMEWGTTTDYGETERFLTGTSTTGISSEFFRIDTEPNTTYHYRAFVFDGVNYYHGEDRTFTSTAPSTPPQMSDPRVAFWQVGSFDMFRPEISSDKARLETFFFSGALPATLEFEYGTTVQFGQSVEAAGSDHMYQYQLVGATLRDLQPDTKYYWRGRASNSIGTFYTDTFSFSTLKAPVVTTRPAISVTDSSATLVGGITPDKWVYDLEIAYGLDPSMPFVAGQITPPWVDGVTFDGTDLSNRNLTATVSGLLPNTTYHYQMRARPDVFRPGVFTSPTTYAGEILTFQTGPPATPPTIGGSLLASGQTETTARLFLESFHAGSSESTVTFEYGMTGSYGMQVVHPGIFAISAADSPEITLTGLSPDSTYHARVKITNAQGTAYSADLEFSTLPPGVAPSFTGSTGTQSISMSSAQLLTGSIIPGDAVTTLLFEYGPTDQYGSSTSLTVSASNVATSRSSSITGLQPGTQYHFRITATSIYGTATTPDSVFTTSAAPVVTTTTATSVTDISALIGGEVTPNGLTTSVRLEWGATTEYGNLIYPPGFYIGGTATVPFSATLEGLQPDTTYHYRIAFGSILGADMTFTTGPPSSLPTLSGNLIVFGLSTTGVSLRIPEAHAGGSQATISFEYGTSIAYGQEFTLPQTIAAGAKLLNATGTIDGLLPLTIYHIRAKATNSQGTVYGNNHTFSTSSGVTTGLVSGLTPFRAVLNGTANPGGIPLNLSFRWSESPGLSNSSLASPSSATGFQTISTTSQPVSLNPNTTYFYRLQGVDPGSGLVTGQTLSFTTPAAPSTPSVYNPEMGINFITSNSASLRFTSVHPGDASTTVTFEYGTTTNYGSSAFGGAPFNPGSFVLSQGSISGLLPDTLYHVRIKATNQHGSAYSGDFSFRTLPLPVFTALPATNVTDLSATLNGRVLFNGNPGISPRFAYGVKGTNPLYYNSISPSGLSTDPNTGAKNYSASLTGLLPDTEYSFRIETFNSYQSEEVSFRTLPAATRPSFLTNNYTVSASHNKAAVNFGSVKSGSSNSTIVIEYGITAAYGSSASVGSVSMNQTYLVSTTLTGLTPGTTYHARARAINAQGTTYSNDFTFTTFTTPILTLGAVQNISDISALLNGSVNPGGRNLSIRFRLVPNGVGNPTVNSSAIVVQGSVSNPISFDAYSLLKTGLTYSCKLTAFDGLNDYESNTVSFTTGAPSSPPVVLGTVNPTSLTSSSVTLRLTSPTGGHIMPGATATNLTYEYGLTESFGNSAAYPAPFYPPSIGYASSAVNLSGLSPGSTYYIRAKATNAQGSGYSGTVTIRTLPTIVPETLPAEEIGEYTARLRGLFADPGSPVTPTFQYGLTDSYGSSISAGIIATQPGDPKEAVANPQNLLPGTTYHYRFRISYAGAQTYFYGEDRTFTTLPQTPVPPSFGNRPNGSVQGTSSVLISTICDSGSSVTDFVLEYGTTDAFANTVVFTSSVAANTRANYQKTVTGLTPGTTYFFRIKATSAHGTAESRIISLITREMPVPYGITAFNIGLYNASLIGSIQSQAGSPNVSFEWGDDANYGNTKGAPKNGNSYSTTITGLFPSRTYHYRLVSTHGSDIVYSEDMTFTTAPVPEPPFVGEILNSYGVTAEAATVWIDRVGAPADIIFEYGTTPQFGQSVAFPQTVVNDYNYRNVAVDLEDLIPDTVYHYRCVATNNQGTTNSATFTFRTLPAPELLVKQATGVSGEAATFRAEVNPNQNLLSPTFEYGLTPAFGSFAPPAQALLSGANSAGVSADVAELLPSTTYHYRLTAVDPRGRKYMGPPATLTTLSKLKDWRLKNFGFEANSGIAADLASTSEDGTPNLIKYALGITPDQRAPNMLRQNEVLGKKRLGLSFTRDPEKTELIYTVEANNSLTGTWDTLATSINGAASTGPGVITESGEGSEIDVDVSDTIDMASKEKRFIRLKVSRTE